MPNYDALHLYELLSYDDDGNVVKYRGRTTMKPAQRLRNHKSAYNRFLEGKGVYCSSYEVMKHGNVRIEIVETISVAGAWEASRREGEFIRADPACVNKMKNYSVKERNIINAENVKKWKKKHYETHKEQSINYTLNWKKTHKESIAKHNAEKIECECGEIITKGARGAHLKRWRHFHNFIYL
jgi:hypothetical protein